MNKLADKLAEWVGTAHFLAGFTFITVAWILAGILGIDKEYAVFTVLLSILAIYMTSIIQRSTNTLNKNMMGLLRTIKRNEEEVLRRDARIERKIDRIRKGTDMFIGD